MYVLHQFYIELEKSPAACFFYLNIPHLVVVADDLPACLHHESRRDAVRREKI